MEFFMVPMLICAGIFIILSGPAAFIMSLIALKKINRLAAAKQLQEIPQQSPRTESPIEKPAAEQMQAPVKPPVTEQQPVKTDMRDYAHTQQLKSRPPYQKQVKPAKPADCSLEQTIGTRWVLLAGVITVIVGVGFFMKYAYDNALIGPFGRVIIAVVGGLIALAVGEITRKKGFDMVAKAVTALGFAILYAAVFSAYQFYGLIGMMPAFAFTILITLASMLYAVSLNENLIAILSLLGGFSAPLLMATSHNMPLATFPYILILGCGAMLCAFYRRWRLVNLTAFILTMINYLLWLDKFYIPAARKAEGMPEQMPVALVWLTIFFAVYLVLPLLNGLVRRIKAQKADVLLVASNAAVTFIFLAIILFEHYRTAMAFSVIGLCAAHLAVMKAAIIRCREDIKLSLILLVIALLFLTVAVPIYFELYALAIVWALEAVVITLIGIKYKSTIAQAAGIAVLMLSLGQLLINLPLHTAAFRPVLNPAFGSWMLVAAALLVCHILYRKAENLAYQIKETLMEPLYCLSVSVFAAAGIMEWYFHCFENALSGQTAGFIRGLLIIMAAMLIPLVLRPLCPAGKQCKIFTVVVAVAASLCSMFAFSEIYEDSFTIFFNPGMLAAAVFVFSLFTTAYIIKKRSEQENSTAYPAGIIAVAAVFTLWILLSEEIYLYWYYFNKFVERTDNWRLLANMYISVMWAVYGAVLMTIGFRFKNAILRYLALGLFAILLFKVFIIDMSTVKSVYRIAAFLATGLTLVGVSYLYQHLKNKGFFEMIAVDTTEDKQPIEKEEKHDEVS